jgi:hypothetical protein
MEDRLALLQQRLNVDELPRPVILVQDLLAESEAIGARVLRLLCAGQIVGIREAEDEMVDVRWK